MISDAPETRVHDSVLFQHSGELSRLKEAEGDGDRQFVERYQFYTDFPFSAEKIRRHLGEIIAQAAKETSVPVVMATCDKQCSLGDGEGYNNALPGSDADGIFFLTQTPITDEQRDAFIDSLIRKNYSWLVELDRNSFGSAAFFSIEELSEVITTQNQVALPYEARVTIHSVLHGTTLFQREDLDLAELTESDKVKDTMKSVFVHNEDSMPPQKKEKYESRAWLMKNFESLSFKEKALLIKLYLHFTRASLSLIDPHVDGRDAESLSQLSKKTGVLKIVEDYDGRLIYRPMFMSHPYVFDIVRRAVLAKSKDWSN